ncbi:MAG: DNA mismatch repair endonuclease MutL, partial [Clostridia bacterium]
MGNIVLLDDLTINKIAAGEVIERPASVIKEMVENSIDAGANNITVEIKNGGISFIKVTDNGKGIAPDDLEIAFERHATSKIRSAEDLDVVTSMGFRGEALASIAAIANVEMISKTESQDTGYKIVVEAGNVLDKQEVGCQTGTSITVRNLFFNTPVRYKFLKKDYTESGYIEDVITRIALVNPDIAIKLINTGKTVIQTNGNGDIKSVIYSIYGKDVATGILPVDYTYEDIQISGVIGKPEIARSNRSNQLFFVNKRYIKDKTLSAATEQAFKGLIPIGKFGFVILNIKMDPSKVDVNVHPAKLEVRFQEENKIFQSIYHAIKDVLLKSELVADTEKVSNTNEVQKEESKGLFDFRKNETEKIEKYNDEESKIKTDLLILDETRRT